MIQSDPKLQWWTRLAWHVYEHLPTVAEMFLGSCFRYALPFSHLRVPITIVRGSTRSDSQPATIIVAGDAHHVDHVIHRFLEAEPRREALGKVQLWTLPSTLRRLRPSGDLTIVRLDRVSAGLFFGTDYLAVPDWVGSVLTVPDNLEALTCGNRSLRSDLRIVRRNSLKHEVVEADADFTQFYQTMYLPFVRRRHAQHAFIRNDYWMRRAFRRGGLMWILQDGQRVAGLLFRRRGQVLYSVAIGTARGEDRFVREGANIATDLFVLEHAKRLGCTLIDFGGSRPFLNDGVLRYKRKWGVTLVDKQDARYDLLVHWNRLTRPVLAFHSNVPLIFRDEDGLSALCLIERDSPIAQAEVSKIHRSVWIPGLRRLYLAATSGWQNPKERPAQTVLLDLTDGRAFDPRALHEMSSSEGRTAPKESVA